MSVRRLDRGEYRKAQKTANGWLKADGYLSRVGVFPYLREDGTVQHELRLPEEVFKPESMQTFAQVPVTDDHPPVFLDDTNTGQYSVGSLGDTLRRDGDFLVGPISVWSGKTVAKVDSGKQELSLGYFCDLDFKPGVWKDDAGKEHRYDAIQRNIRGNHVALVRKGRAGPQARIRLDAAGDAVLDADDGGEDPPKPKDGPTMIKKNIDGVDAEVSEQASQLIDRAKAKADAQLAEAVAKAAAAEAAHQTAKAKADALAEEVKKKTDALAEATDPSKVQASIKARVDLETKARAVLGVDAKLDSMDSRGVQVAVLAKLNPKLDLKDAADAYVQGRFDMAIDGLGADALAKVRTALAGGTGTGSGTGTGKTDEANMDADALAHKKMIEANTNAWKVAQKSA